MQSAQFALHAQIEDRHWWFVARRKILRRLAGAVVPAGHGHTVLDVGCGTGANLAALADDYSCVGIDSSSDAIELARGRFPEIEFRRGFAPADVGDVLDRTSLVLLTDVLEHVPDDFSLFSSLFAAVRPGTWFLVTVPADDALWSRHDESFGHYRRYEAERLARIWQGLPATCALVSYYNSRLYPAVKLVRWWNRRRGSAHGAAGTDFNMPLAPVNRALEWILADESRRLLSLVAGRRRRAYGQGVSLIALVRREAGDCPVRTRPADVPADVHQPA
ncbi:MAG TPA: class I SAM-dependent methyltransferase [Pirellulales bacterium]|nr:class I SAM-dependent methyltransferase [Pirellulales bacterium]